MSITIDFTPAEIALIKEQATACNTTAEEFIRQASAKAARNAEYLAKLDKGFKQMEEGKFTHFSDEELRRLIYGD
ncbi:MAG: hypothetical protein IJT01_14260 [Selenomonadaceae bacterium]|nr:hypothetical protein [Selenomonadaceae bacterium]